MSAIDSHPPTTVGLGTAAKPPATLDDLNAGVAQVAELAAARDNEAAHGEEDGVWADALDAIAAGAPNAAELAAAALKTRSVVYHRWYA